MLNVSLRHIFILFLFVFSISEQIWAAEAKDDSSFGMPFKIGFEFQESSHLCPWALTNFKLQKISYLFVSDQETKRPLWNLVIDSDDLEFVTEPFSHTELPLLTKAISSILVACQDLQTLSNSKISIQFQSWIDRLTASLDQETLCLIVNDTFKLVSDQQLILPSTEDDDLPEAWIPKFMPQVTFQHPLEHTIPLYFGMFGFNSAKFMDPFLTSLPYLASLATAQQETDLEDFNKILMSYRKKVSGLVFLNALTLVNIAPNDDYEDWALLNRTKHQFVNDHQIDLKAMLPLMVRRPFSQIFIELKSELSLTEECYEMLFNKCMDNNAAYFNILQYFNKINYGEQFFDPDTGKPLGHVQK